MAHAVLIDADGDGPDLARYNEISPINMKTIDKNTDGAVSGR
jgi:hypothetical protein